MGISMSTYPKDEPGIRLGRIRKMMDERGLDAMIFYSPQWKLEAVHYVANFRVLGEEAAVVLPRSDEPTLLIGQPWDLLRAKMQSWIENIEVCQADMMARAGKIAASYGSHIGIVGAQFMAAPKHAAMIAGLSGKTVTNEYAALDQAAKVKTPWEVEIMRECARLADIAYMAEMDALRLGVSEYELVAELEYAMKQHGADENFQMIGMGRNLPSMNRARENYLKMGDFVLTEITPIIGCITYATQLCRTVKMGEATPLEREKHELLCQALEYALSKIKSGIKAKDICIWQNEIIGAAGYEDYCHPPHMRSRGHNFGLGYIDLSEDNEETLYTDTILVIHPNQMIPEVGYLVCGLTVRITDDGCERLSALSTKMFEAIPAK